MNNLSLYKKDYPVELSDVDFQKDLKLSVLFNHLQDAASLHADQLGVGFGDLTENHGVTWVLLRLRAEIIKNPRLHDLITVKTWPQSPLRAEFERDFEIFDAEKRLLVKASSIWVVLDLKTRRLKRMDAILKNFPQPYPRRALSEGLQRLKGFQNLNPAYQKVVGYSDVDVNGHLNNAKYVDYALDCFSLSEHRDVSVKSFEINYLSEAFAGETICLQRGEDYTQDGLFYVQGLNALKENLIFKSRIQFESKSQ